MLTSILPNYYKFLYLVHTSYLLTLYFANFHFLRDLQTTEEQNNGRRLLTVTATFTYKKELRWVWYYISILCCIIYGGVAPAYYKAYFSSFRFLKSLKPNRKLSILALRCLTCSSVAWSLCLSCVIFLIQGKYPAEEATIENWIWYNHFLVLFLFLVSCGVNFFSFLYLVSSSNTEMRINHHFKFKLFVAIFYVLSILMMIIYVILSSIYPHRAALFKDIVCLFEYTTVLCVMCFNGDVWSGFTYVKNKSYYETKLVLVTEDPSVESRNLLFGYSNIHESSLVGSHYLNGNLLNMPADLPVKTGLPHHSPLGSSKKTSLSDISSEEHEMHSPPHFTRMTPKRKGALIKKKLMRSVSDHSRILARTMSDTMHLKRFSKLSDDDSENSLLSER